MLAFDSIIKVHLITRFLLTAINNDFPSVKILVMGISMNVQFFVLSVIYELCSVFIDHYINTRLHSFALQLLLLHMQDSL